MPAAQSAPYLPHEIEYTRNITLELVEQHKRAWQAKGKKLVSAILFGPLAVKEYDENINLLEIVEGYPPKGSAVIHEFESTRQFPMYGRLRLRIVSPEEFKSAVTNQSPWIASVRDQNLILSDTREFAKKLLR